MNNSNKDSETPFNEQMIKCIDQMIGYEEKLEFLNGQFLKAKTISEENTLLSMMDDLKQWGS